jgi:putative transposase
MIEPWCATGSGNMARAVAESFFQLLKRERIRRRTYQTRDAARQDVFEYIEMFYNPKRKHTNNGMLSPVDFENRQQKLNEAGVYKTRGISLHRRRWGSPS